MRFIINLCVNCSVLLALTLCLPSCKKDVRKETVVYANDFESGNLANIQNGHLYSYGGGTNMGRYNASGFALDLKDLPSHDFVEISFNLYIHDSWDGNNSQGGLDGPDIWQMKVDGDTLINTTFSNSYFLQSYPDNYPAFRLPKTNARPVLLAGACIWQHEAMGSSVYDVKKLVKHSGAALYLECLDKLRQPNSPTPSCDESWSIDNISITAIETN
ncbi:hypothetical protein [Hufsiella ginkgonis]|uniref:Uncharacterized protein n=1 Tax=Hufsiella ginkgonis TaxID=2695274 RepID=A0A7K1Y291_9SPHI|nr:hypothetical protein [Hufsiella ginkgonis]MXV17375.1 hypothetical protein [Hufsiella ginkgonis]